MKPVSIAMQENNTYEPDPDSLGHWFNLPVTQHYLYKLKLLHQKAVEGLADVNMGNSYNDLKEVHTVQASAELLVYLINDIEGLSKDAEREDDR